jgi:mannose-6-phosphate isomerase-like protein (cupin superfamily)
MKLRPKYVEKSWGWEFWFANVNETIEMPLDDSMVKKEKNISYCGKLFYIRANEWSSKGKFHYHNDKDETFFVLEGELFLEIENERSGSITDVILKQNESYRIKAGLKHRFTTTTVTGCKFMEVSTFHSDEDSYRCEKNEANEWIVS